MNIIVAGFDRKLRRDGTHYDLVLIGPLDGQRSCQTWHRISHLKPRDVPKEYDGLTNYDESRAAQVRLWVDVEPAYKAWLGGDGFAETGTPLEEWAGVAGSEVASLKLHGIRTVESLAALSDVGLRNANINIRVKQAAASWLESRVSAGAASRVAEQDAVIANLAAELERIKGTKPKAKAA